MAIIKPGPLVSEVRGKIGGVVFARNKGGLYVRNFAAPTQGQFEAREDAKAAFGYLSNLWGSLTQGQRDGWAAYGQSVPTINSLGEEQGLTGLAAFMRGNAILRRAGLPVAMNAPDVGVRGPTMGQPVVSVTASGAGVTELTVAFSSADPYGQSNEAVIQAQRSGAVTTARESPSGLAMRFIGAPEVETNGPGSADEFDLTGLVPDLTYWFRFRLATLDGRLGPDRYVRVTMT